MGVPVAYPANVRVTRLAAARQRLLQQQQLLTQQQTLGDEPMMVEPNLDHESDPQSCCQYVKEIYHYLREREQRYAVSPHFMQVGVPPLYPPHVPYLPLLRDLSKSGLGRRRANATSMPPCAAS